MGPLVHWIDAPRRLRGRRAVRKWLAAADVPGSLRGQIVVLSVRDLVSSTASAADEIVKQFVVERDAKALVVATWPGERIPEIVFAGRRRHLGGRVDYATTASETRWALYARGVPKDSYVNANAVR